MKIGASVDGRIIHLNSFLSASEQLPENMVNIMAMGDVALQLAKQAISSYLSKNNSSLGTIEELVDLQSPILNPSKIMMGGRNYLRHLDELRKELRDNYFGKDSYFQKLSNQKCIPVFDIIGKINDKTYGHLVNNTGENDYTKLLEVIKNEIK